MQPLLIRLRSSSRRAKWPPIPLRPIHHTLPRASPTTSGSSVSSWQAQLRLLLSRPPNHPRTKPEPLSLASSLRSRLSTDATILSQSSWPPRPKPAAPPPRTLRLSRDGYKHFGGGPNHSPSPHTPYVALFSAAAAAAYLYANLDYAPFTGRRRILGISRAQELAMGEHAFRELLLQFDGRVLHPRLAASRRVRGVVSRIATTARALDPALTDGFDWQVAVVDVPEPNALCVPGGRMLITTGLLRILPTDDDLAVVLAHEIAHALNRHGAESMHLQRLLIPLLIILNQVFDMRWFPSMLVNFFVSLPYGRKLEYEADEVGLTLCAEACYDPRVAPDVFRRLGEIQNERSGSLLADKIEPFLSTHPQSKERAKRLRDSLPQKLDRYNTRCIRRSSHQEFWNETKFR